MSSSAHVEHAPTDLREYVGVLRRRKWSVILVVLILVGAAFAYSVRQTPIYEATAKVQVQPLQNPFTVNNPRNNVVDTSTETALIDQQLMAARVQKKLGITTSTTVLLKRLSANAENNTSFIDISYRDPKPSTAATIANTFASEYLAYRQEQATIQLTAAIKPLSDQVDALKGQLQGVTRQLASTTDPFRRQELENSRQELTGQIANLTNQIIQTRAQFTQPTGVGQIVQSATVPRRAVSPNYKKNIAAAFAVGLILGLGLAFLRETMDDRVRTREELERRLGAPVIAAVPKQKGWRRAEEAQLIMRADPKNPVSEAYRTLGTNVQYLASRQSLQVFMVTSATGGDGKTTTAANLAVVLAQSGRRVILVSADMRKPRLHAFFGMGNDIGLSDALANGADLPQVAKDPGIDNLRIIPGGPVPADPAALLTSKQSSTFFESLRSVADFIVLDTPPVLAVADASILSPITDGTVYVLNADNSSRSAMLHARDQLENSGANILGAVYNNFDPDERAGYASYYYYYQYYGLPSGSENGARRRLGRRKNREAAVAGADERSALGLGKERQSAKP